MTDKRSTDCILLGVLMTESKHGYEIRQFLDDSLESKWHIGNSQMYMLLKRLEKNRLLKSYLQVQTTRPSRRVYSLTPKGENKFLEWIETPVMHPRNLRTEFIAKLFFIYRLSLSSGHKVIQNQIDALEYLLKKVLQTQSRESRPFERLSLGFRQVTIEAYIRWLKTAASQFVDHIQRG